MFDKTTTAQDEIRELTDQFYVTLRAAVSRLGKDSEIGSPKSFTHVEQLLNGGGNGTWSQAYQIEQHLVDLLDERTLEVELQTRLLEAESSLRPALVAQYGRLAGTLQNPAQKRALLARLVNDLQWRYTVNEVKRNYSKDITKTTGMIFITAIGAFAAAILLMALLGDRASMGGNTAHLLLAGLAGGWGASFSMLSGLRSRIDAADLNDLKLMKSRWILWSRPLIGVGAACILFFFVASGLLGGTALPDLNGGAAAAAGLPPQSAGAQVALLIVWCFVAGFSERLVPALLAKTETGINDGTSGDRFKPGPSETPSPTGAGGKASPHAGADGNGNG